MPGAAKLPTEQKQNKQTNKGKMKMGGTNVYLQSSLNYPGSSF